MLAFCISAHDEYQSRAHQAGMLWNIRVTTLQLLNIQTLIYHNVTMLAFHISALGSTNPEHSKKGSYGPMVSQLCMLDKIILLFTLGSIYSTNASGAKQISETNNSRGKPAGYLQT